MGHTEATHAQTQLRMKRTYVLVMRVVLRGIPALFGVIQGRARLLFGSRVGGLLGGGVEQSFDCAYCQEQCGDVVVVT
jgi:hypothetical protein